MKKFQNEYTKMLLDYTNLHVGRENRLREIVQNGLPSLEKFASLINVTRKTLDAWADRRKDFAIALEEAKARIADALTDAAAMKLADPAFIKFLLCEKYGLGEKSEDEGAETLDVNITVVK